ncbi:hypothetical protein MWU49_02940 [Alcanivorax sp. S6407]|uniref:hypothetical protein n=1 Tax=Alcanivorax sp. S6407 TaxID=2926424 RepID=UPI001FF2D419|nr:hypothetical protein [Alcanivorax sp. S6407]MCK0152645.1 hypothetical protein [Alcanivorax sp. S6407]
MNSQLQATQISKIWQRGMARRQFLKWGLGGVAAVTAVAAGSFALLRRSPRDEIAPPDWATGLSASEYHLFEHARAVLLPVEGTNLIDSSTVPVVQNVQQILDYLDAPTRKELGAGLSLFDNVVVFSHGCRFVDLEPGKARELFDRWGEGSVLQRTLTTVIKQLVYSGYWQEPATWPPTEFDGPVSEKWGLAYLGNAPLPQQPSLESGQEQA